MLRNFENHPKFEKAPKKGKMDFNPSELVQENGEQGQQDAQAQRPPQETLDLWALERLADKIIELLRRNLALDMEREGRR